MRDNDRNARPSPQRDDDDDSVRDRDRRGSAQAASDNPDEKYTKLAERIVGQYDKNSDNELTDSEWAKMIMSPAEADSNRDGRVSVDEYASWMQNRSKK
jgi:hypothetical protein